MLFHILGNFIVCDVYLIVAPAFLVQYPTACDRVVQWSEDSWHLPLDTSNWLCAHVPH